MKSKEIIFFVRLAHALTIQARKHPDNLPVLKGINEVQNKITEQIRDSLLGGGYPEVEIQAKGGLDVLREIANKQKIGLIFERAFASLEEFRDDLGSAYRI